MRFSSDQTDYLTGENFSNHFCIKVNGTSPGDNRVNSICAITKNKSVIHLGCCDHLELIDQKIKDNTWLHKLIQDSASKILGIDINQAAIEHITKLGFDNILNRNILSDKISEISGTNWDYLVAAEIIEHQDNPTEFLRIIREKYSTQIGKILITVPNAFSFNNIRFSLFSKECINTDHRYWFTPYTISKVLIEAGYQIEDVFLTNSFNKIKIKNALKLFLIKFFPMLRDNIVITASLKR